MAHRGFPSRSVPGTRIQTSAVGVRIDAARLGPPGSDAHVAPLIARLRGLGITTFELGAGSGALRAERLLATALPAADEDLVILARRSLSDLSRERRRAPSGDLVASLRESLEASASRLAPHRVRLVIWHPTADGGSGVPEVAPALEQLRSEGVIDGWVRQVPRAASLPSEPYSATQPSPLFAGRLSLLEHDLLPTLADRASHGGIGYFADDPYGQGRLDGTRLPAGLGDRPAGSGPPSLSELQREFDPVLRLGFLTGQSRRTLSQAALRFATHWPWVCSALVPLPRPERLAELEQFEATPDLTDAEISRVLALPG